jgi:hypothetical protein
MRFLQNGIESSYFLRAINRLSYAQKISAAGTMPALPGLLIKTVSAKKNFSFFSGSVSFLSFFSQQPESVKDFRISGVVAWLSGVCEKT